MGHMSYIENKSFQIAALPVFINGNGEVEICLVTSRGSGRWIIPKGNPIDGLEPHEVAAQEAREEAGLIGQMEPLSIGTFEFNRNRGGRETTCSVAVYVLKAERQLRKWEERDQRSVRRCSLKKALSLVCSPSLAEIMRQYAGLDHVLQSERQALILA